MVTENDEFTVKFIRIITNDPELDFSLGRLLNLFAIEMPEMDNVYAHHIHQWQLTGPVA